MSLADQVLGLSFDAERVGTFRLLPDLDGLSRGVFAMWKNSFDVSGWKVQPIEGAVRGASRYTTLWQVFCCLVRRVKVRPVIEGSKIFGWQRRRLAAGRDYAT